MRRSYVVWQMGANDLDLLVASIFKDEHSILKMFLLWIWRQKVPQKC
jgi:hypothetical protein